MAVFKSKEKTKDGRIWFYKVYYKDINGNKRVKKSKKFMTRKEAQDAERAFLMNVNDNIDSNLTLDEVFELMKKNDKTVKESTMHTKNDRYKKHIKEYLGSKKINKISINDIIKWKDIIDSKDLSIVYKQAIFNALSSIFAYAYRNNIINKNIIREINNFTESSEKVVDNTEKIRYITYEEFNKFQDAITDLSDKAYFNFLYYTGVRKGEAAALTWNDINFETKKIKIIKQLNFRTFENYPKVTNTKNKKNRVISMPKQLINVLLDYYEFQKKIYGFNKDWYVFGGTKYFSYTTIARHCDQYFKNSNMWDKRITIHEFRHSHASLLISNKIPVNLIANRLGDTIEVVLNTYAHLFPETEKEIIDLLENLGTI